MERLHLIPQLSDPNGLSEAHGAQLRGRQAQLSGHQAQLHGHQAQLPGRSPCQQLYGNLCAEGQSRGLRAGVLFFTLSMALAIGMAKLGAPPALRWLLAAPFFLAIVGVSQSLLQTCPFLALQSLRDPGEGIEPVADPKERAALRARGQRLLLASAVIAIAAAGLFAELPL